jgi:hypothetical protein
MPTFADVVDAANKLSADEQESLLRILRRRIAERNRARLTADIAEARGSLLAEGLGRPRPNRSWMKSAVNRELSTRPGISCENRGERGSGVVFG